MGYIIRTNRGPAVHARRWTRVCINLWDVRRLERFSKTTKHLSEQPICRSIFEPLRPGDEQRPWNQMLLKLSMRKWPWFSFLEMPFPRNATAVLCFVGFTNVRADVTEHAAAWGFGRNKPPAVQRGDYECQVWAGRRQRSSDGQRNTFGRLTIVLLNLHIT